MTSGRRFGFIAARFASAFLQFLLAPVLVKSLGAGSYATFALVHQGGLLIRILVGEHVLQTVLREQSTFLTPPGQFRRALPLVTALIAGLSTLLFGLTLVGRHLFAAAPSAQELGFALCIGMGLALWNLGSITVMSFQRVSLASGLELAVTAVPTLAALFASFSGASVHGCLAAFTGALLTVGLSACLLALRISAKPLPGIAPAWQGRRLLKDTWAYGIPLACGYLMYWITGVADRFQIAQALGRDQAGIYIAHYQLLVAPLSLLTSSIMGMVEPHTFGKEWEVARHWAQRLFQGILLGTAFYFAASFLVSRPLMQLLFRGRIPFQPGLAWLLALVSGAYALVQVEMFLSKFAKDSTGVMVSLGLGALVVLVGNALLLPRFGMLTAAWTSLLAYLVQLAVLRWRRPKGFATSFWAAPLPWKR